MVDQINNYPSSLSELGFADVGITRIDRSTVNEVGLPPQREAQLTGQPINQKLAGLFPQHHLNKAMKDFADPFIADPSILLPARFDHLIRQSAATLSSVSEHHPNPSVKAAAEILDNEAQMRNLLHEYRMALMQA